MNTKTMRISKLANIVIWCCGIIIYFCSSFVVKGEPGRRIGVVVSISGAGMRIDGRDIIVAVEGWVVDDEFDVASVMKVQGPKHQSFYQRVPFLISALKSIVDDKVANDWSKHESFWVRKNNGGFQLRTMALNGEEIDLMNITKNQSKELMSYLEVMEKVVGRLEK